MNKEEKWNKKEFENIYTKEEMKTLFGGYCKRSYFENIAFLDQNLFYKEQEYFCISETYLLSFEKVENTIEKYKSEKYGFYLHEVIDGTRAMRLSYVKFPKEMVYYGIFVINNKTTSQMFSELIFEDDYILYSEEVEFEEGSSVFNFLFEFIGIIKDKKILRVDRIIEDVSNNCNEEILFDTHIKIKVKVDGKDIAISKKQDYFTTLKELKLYNSILYLINPIDEKFNIQITEANFSNLMDGDKLKSINFIQ